MGKNWNIELPKNITPLRIWGCSIVVPGNIPFTSQHYDPGTLTQAGPSLGFMMGCITMIIVLICINNSSKSSFHSIRINPVNPMMDIDGLWSASFWAPKTFRASVRGQSTLLTSGISPIFTKFLGGVFNRRIGFHLKLLLKPMVKS